MLIGSGSGCFTIQGDTNGKKFLVDTESDNTSSVVQWVDVISVFLFVRIFEFNIEL